ncbi:PAP2 superfamily protein [Streptomyces sp. YIM 130001]|uniref:phosphatase PAP2 family protein n=1 Tax=Streptomyces sp. YIM 130001 TaxID=2259644 RepID=UPI000EEE9D52|nr:phosphatase PAP2 family protein [Streptomyces sp. YIM 130001]RII09623.1 PAP2 superfamily protein [Streptomyces sp. YIM 130001]
MTRTWYDRRVLYVLLPVLLALLSWQAAVDGPVRRFDERLAGGLRGLGLPRQPAEFFADLGGLAVALPVLALALAAGAVLGHRAGVRRWWLPPLAGASALAAVPLLVAPLKALVGRDGPPGMALGEGFFPSGHAATAVVAYGAAALVLLPCVRSARRRREAAVAYGLLMVLIGTGLVQRGYHWPLDVLGSWCLGGMLLLALRAALDRTTGGGRTKLIGISGKDNGRPT